MKVSRQQAEANRRAAVVAASRLYRDRGLDGASIADVMAEAGLTHGAFYGQFQSKEALIVEAIAEAARSFPTEDIRRNVKTLPAAAETYLSTKHRDDRAGGCVFAALAGDVVRRGGVARSAFTAAVERRLSRMEALADSASPAERRRESVATMAMMVGALLLARAVDDPALSDEFLTSIRSDGQAGPSAA